MDPSARPARTEYFDALRVFATFCVMILHIAAQNWGTVEVTSAAFTAFNVYDSLVRWTVPVFVMISGALFLGRDIPVRRLYRKNILRIVTAFLVWSALYVLAGYLHGERAGLLTAFLQGHYHMWFLYLIVGLYMLTPFLRQLTLRRELARYFLLLCLIFAYGIPQLTGVLSLGPERFGGVVTVLRYWTGCLNLYFVLGYCGYFVLGWYLSTMEIGPRLERAVYLLGVCAFLATMGLTAWVSRLTGAASTLFYNDFTLNVCMECIAVFVLFRQRCAMHGAPERVRGWIRRLSQYSFGAYLVHAMVIEALGSCGLNTLSFHPALTVPVIGILTFAGSYLVSGLFHQIPVLRDYIV